MRMVVDVRLPPVLVTEVLVRYVRVLHGRVVVLVPMRRRQMLHAARPGVRVVRDVYVIVPVYHLLVIVRYVALSCHDLASFRLPSRPLAGLFAVRRIPPSAGTGRRRLVFARCIVALVAQLFRHA